MDEISLAGRARGGAAVSLPGQGRPAGCMYGKNVSGRAGDDAGRGQMAGGRASCATDRELWQRRALGHLLHAVMEAHDFVGSVCYADERGFVTEERKRTVAKVNSKLLPWYALLSRVVRPYLTPLRYSDPPAIASPLLQEWARGSVYVIAST